MDNIDKILKYIRRTNPDMTRQKLIEELGQSHYIAKALVIVSNQKMIDNQEIKTRIKYLVMCKSLMNK